MCLELNEISVSSFLESQLSLATVLQQGKAPHKDIKLVLLLILNFEI